MSNTNPQQISSFLAGILAGASGILVGHPLDTLKVRYQVGRQIDEVSINRKYIRELYRGIIPPLITSGAIQSINFSLYERFKRFYHKNLNINYLSSVFYAGTTSGALITIITTPIACVKLQQQISTRKGMIECSKQMYREYGITSFYRGYSTFFIMESFGRGVYLWTYESSKYQLSKLTNLSDSNLIIKMLSAAAAGCFSWLVVYPLDVIKSRLQLDISRSKYKNTWECGREIYQLFGIRGFFRGISFTLIRAAPVASTILPVYEYSKDHIENIIIKTGYYV